jgi:hypothetical protein
MTFKAKLQQARLELELAKRERDADPLLPLVAAAVSGFEAVSTTAVLTMVGLRPTTGNARKVARSMRTLRYVPIKNRRMPPGGWTDTLCRGWAKSPRRQKSARVSSFRNGVLGQEILAAGTVCRPTVESVP